MLGSEASMSDALLPLIAAAAGLLSGLVAGLVPWFFSRRRAARNHERSQALTQVLARQLERGDPEVGKHLRRMVLYVDLLAEALVLPRALRRDLEEAAPLHDIGKAALPDAILQHTGVLTPEEREVMKNHCRLGEAMVHDAEKLLGAPGALELVRQVVLTHHERWDGAGYPQGLAGPDIPLAGRILALADVYDALRSRRPYKQARSHEACVQTIELLTGSHFDPQVVEAFLLVKDEFRRVSEAIV